MRSLLQNNHTSSKAYPTSYQIGAGGGGSLGQKQLGHEADYSPTSSGAVKNEWTYTSAPQCMPLWRVWGQLYLYV
jgi:hypothetical protein